MIDIIKKDIQTPFTKDRFSLSRLPHIIGKAKRLFPAMPSCLDMPIKLPGKTALVPAPYKTADALTDILNQAFAFETTLLPNWQDTHYVYLTVDQRLVVPGKTHRNAGWHFDGMQGTRYPQKLNACHQYVCSSTLPTLYTNAITNATDLDEEKDNWFTSLGAQIPETHPIWTPKPYDIVLMSAYQLHKSPTAKVPTHRTFVRIDFSLKQQDRLGNTPNPDMLVPWTYTERTLPEGLNEPIKDSGWKSARKLS